MYITIYSLPACDIGIGNIVADMLIILPYIFSNNYKPCTRKAQCHANKLFAIGRV